MKKILLFVVVSLFATGITPIVLSGQDFANRPYIEVTGKAEKEVAPDRIYLEIVINESDYKNQSLSSIEKKMIDKLKECGIDTKKDLVIKDLASNFKHYVLKKDDVRLKKEYQVLTTSAQMAGEVILALESIGVSRVSVGKVECSKIAQYENEARVEAVKNAKSKALLLTQPLDQELGKAIHISEQEFYNRYNSDRVQIAYSKKNMEASLVGSSVPDIEFEKIRIECRVYVKFELK